MVPKANGFCLALPCQLAADRLAAAAGLMLALHWPSGPRPLDPLPFGHWSRRTPVTIGIGRYRHSSLLARDGARNHSINRTVQRSTKPPVPEFCGLRHLVRERHMPVGTMATRAIVPRTEPVVR